MPIRQLRTPAAALLRALSALAMTARFSAFAMTRSLPSSKACFRSNPGPHLHGVTLAVVHQRNASPR
jgi:hypothetical protein